MASGLQDLNLFLDLDESFCVLLSRTGPAVHNRVFQMNHASRHPHRYLPEAVHPAIGSSDESVTARLGSP